MTSIANSNNTPYPLALTPSTLPTKCLDKPQSVGCYQPLLGDSSISVYLEQNRLFAVINDHATGAPSVRLELVGVPKELTREIDLQKLTTFFESTHLIPEKGVNGVNRVSVHVSADGGMRAGIPFQPGLGLGTIVRGDIIPKMEAYVKKAALKQRLEEQIQSTEQEIDALETKIQSRLKKKGKDDSLIILWRAEIEENTKLIGAIAGRLRDAFATVPLFDDFQQGIESPIDFKNSTFEVQARGFDSMHFSSQFIDLTEEFSSIHDKIDQSSRSTSASAGGGYLLWKVKGSVSHSSAVLDRLYEMKSERKNNKVLVINSTVTTRNVRTLTEAKYDMEKLKMLLSVMERANDKELERFGISTLDSDEKCIYLLTEAVLGGSFTALVTFEDTSTLSRVLKMGQKQSSTSGSISGSGGIGAFSIGAKVAHASAKAAQNEDDKLNAEALTKVNIEFISQGTLPAFNRHEIEREILRHANLDPSKYELTSVEKKDIENVVKAKKEEDLAIANLEIQLKLQKAQEATLNTVRGLAEVKQTQSIHTTDSAFEAYEDFTKKITEDEDCGVPIGFFYKVLTQKDIRRIIDEHTKAQESAIMQAKSEDKKKIKKPAKFDEDLSPDEKYPRSLTKSPPISK